MVLIVGHVFVLEVDRQLIPSIHPPPIHLLDATRVENRLTQV